MWYGPDEHAICNGGLQEGDTVVVDWLTSNRVAINGGRLEVFRHNKRLKWLPGGFSRDPGGMCVLVPYLTTRDDAEEFVGLVGFTSGHKVVMSQSRATACKFELVAGNGAGKLLPGDLLTINLSDKVLAVMRSQPSLDSEIYKGEGGEWILFQKRLPYMGTVNHPHAIVRVLAEANGHRVKPNGTPSSFVIDS